MTIRTPRRRAAACALAVAAVLAAPACSASGSGPVPTSAPPVPSAAGSSGAATSAPASAGATAGSATAPTDPSATAAPRPPLAGRELTGQAAYSNQARVRLRFDVVELKRRGDLLDLTATLTNLETDRSRDLRYQVGSRFTGVFRQDIESSSGVFTGVVLTDVAGKKRYLVAADSGNRCVCTVNLSAAFVGAGQSIELSATYAAPPPTTTTLDVTVASLGTFRDLPVT